MFKPINIMSGTFFSISANFLFFFRLFFYANTHNERVVLDVLDSAAGKRSQTRLFLVYNIIGSYIYYF